MSSVLTRQEIFETVATHLFTQGIPARDDGDLDYCYYRMADGRKCAIGILIQDDEYSEDMENMTVEALNKDNRMPKRLDYDNNFKLLQRLQSCHDADSNWENQENLREYLRDIAASEKLDGKFLDSLSFAS